MTVLDILKAAGVKGGDALVSLLTGLKEKAPDAAEAIDHALGEITGAVSPDNLAKTGVAIISELKDIGSGKIDGRFHPSDMR